jgi:hypothetical protein
MSLFKPFIFGLALGLASSAALAFQEQQGRPTATEPQAQKPAQLTPDAGGTSKPAVSGTDVRVPGLGKLGSLPKMDFGLELLYGVTEPKQPETQGRDDVRDDLTIRGSVKHKF